MGSILQIRINGWVMGVAQLGLFKTISNSVFDLKKKIIRIKRTKNCRDREGGMIFLYGPCGVSPMEK